MIMMGRLRLGEGLCRMCAKKMEGESEIVRVLYALFRSCVRSTPTSFLQMYSCFEVATYHGQEGKRFFWMPCDVREKRYVVRADTVYARPSVRSTQATPASERNDRFLSTFKQKKTISHQCTVHAPCTRVQYNARVRSTHACTNLQKH